MTYIHTIPDWPLFNWDTSKVSSQLAAVRYRQGKLSGRMNALSLDLRNEAMLRIFSNDVVNSSQIEAITLDKDQVRAAIANRLGFNIAELRPYGRYVDGVAEMNLDAAQAYDTPLDQKRLFGWHAALFPTGLNETTRNSVGQWREGPMQVLSERYGSKKMHFEAPGPERLEAEMARFLTWFNKAPDTDPVIHAAIAYLWFITVHPFDGGNGRIARAIADMALARSEASSQRFYSMSTQIWQDQNAYHDMLATTQLRDLDVTGWLNWFLNCLDSAFDGAEIILGAVFQKARFQEAYGTTTVNARQRNMLNRLLDGFEEKLTTSNYAKLEKCSQDTAYRDILELINLGALEKDEAGGRSTSYSLSEL